MSVDASSGRRTASREGDWDERRDELGDLVVATLETVAPGIGELVTARQVLTPARPRARLRPHGRPSAPRRAGARQFFAWRPLLGRARYRMPVDGLYLAGSGAHPGGGVTGAPGRNAAREILADRKRRNR